MIDYYFKKLGEEISKLYYKTFHEPIKASDIHKEFYRQFNEVYERVTAEGWDNMELQDYMINAYLLGDNLRKVIDKLEEEVKREIPPIIKNSCENIYVEYMEDEGVVRIVLDCFNNVEKDINQLLDDFCEGWYSDNHYDYGLSFCYDLNPDNIEKFTKGGKEWLMKNNN